MRRTPRDPAFNKVIRAEIENTRPNERVLFIDNENRIRHAIYPSEYHVLQGIRRHLEDEGVLKAVVHVSAVTTGDPSGHGPRTSVVEYLPDRQGPTGPGRYYTTVFRPALMYWDENNADAVEQFEQLFGGEEEPPSI